MRISDWSSDVCSSDLLVIGDVGEVLHQCAERVAVGGDDDALACLQVGGDAFLPIGQDAGDGVLQRFRRGVGDARVSSEEHTSELQSLMRISYAVFPLKKKRHKTPEPTPRIKKLK